MSTAWGWSTQAFPDVVGRQGQRAANPEVVHVEPCETFWGSVSSLVSFRSKCSFVEDVCALSGCTSRVVHAGWWPGRRSGGWGSWFRFGKTHPCPLPPPHNEVTEYAAVLVGCPSGVGWAWWGVVSSDLYCSHVLTVCQVLCWVFCLSEYSNSPEAIALLWAPFTNEEHCVHRG